MGREVYRMRKRFQGPMKETWWGYVLPSVPCQSCDATGIVGSDHCVVCGGEGKAYPKVEPPGWPAGMAPSYVDADWIHGRYGWQLWETTSEGSPISPVCDTPEELARWLADNRASAFADMTATYEQWLAMIRDGSAVSAVFTPEQGLISGVAATDIKKRGE